MTAPAPNALAERLEQVQALDPPAEFIGKTVRQVIPSGPVKDGLSGTWLGHALHPLLTDVPIGAFTSAVLLDLFGGKNSENAAERLLAIGIAATPATIATGWNDWADAEPANEGVRRSGIVHAVVNATAVGFFAGSLAARRSGSLGRGRMLSLAGMGLMSVGGWLGGHLSYSQGVGVETTTFETGGAEWTATGLDEADLAENEPRCVLIEDTRVLLVRQSGTIHALADRCTHRGGMLHEGEVGDGTITCPLHGSCFSLADGGVLRGPATFAQPLFEARVVSGGAVEVKRAR